MDAKITKATPVAFLEIRTPEGLNVTFQRNGVVEVEMPEGKRSVRVLTEAEADIMWAACFGSVGAVAA